MFRDTLAHRLWRRITIDRDGCWIWAGCLANGYGQIRTGSKGEAIVPAHVAAWLVTHGIIPDGMIVLRTCCKKLCCRPDHLFLSTYVEFIRSRPPSRGVGNGHAKLTDLDVLVIRKLRERGISISDIQRKFSFVSYVTIFRTCKREIWKHLPQTVGGA